MALITELTAIVPIWCSRVWPLIRRKACVAIKNARTIFILIFYFFFLDLFAQNLTANWMLSKNFISILSSSKISSISYQSIWSYFKPSYQLLGEKILWIFWIKTAGNVCVNHFMSRNEIIATIRKQEFLTVRLDEVKISTRKSSAFGMWLENWRETSVLSIPPPSTSTVATETDWTTSKVLMAVIWLVVVKLRIVEIAWFWIIDSVTRTLRNLNFYDFYCTYF